MELYSKTEQASLDLLFKEYNDANADWLQQKSLYERGQNVLAGPTFPDGRYDVSQIFGTASLWSKTQLETWLAAVNTNCNNAKLKSEQKKTQYDSLKASLDTKYAQAFALNNPEQQAAIEKAKIQAQVDIQRGENMKKNGVIIVVVVAIAAIVGLIIWKKFM